MARASIALVVAAVTGVFGQELHVVLSDEANAGARQILRVMGEVERIFLQAEIPLRWGTGNAPDGVLLRLVDRMPASAPRTLIGFTARRPGGGWEAIVSLDRIRGLRRRHGGVVDADHLAAAAIAHELAHVIEAGDQHGDQVMKRSWGTNEFARSGQGALAFSPSQGRRLRKLLSRVSAR